MAMSLALFESRDKVETVQFDIAGIRDTYAEIAEAQKECEGSIVYRIKVGAGGSKNFEIVTGDDDMDASVPSFRGVIIHSHRCNAYWGGSDITNQPPECSSMDGISGVDSDGEVLCCKDCDWNQFGSASKGRGKACKNMQRLYIFVEGVPIPMLLTLPPTSLSAFRSYRVSSLAGRKLKPNEVVTEFTLTQKTTQDGIKYSVVKFRLVGRLNEADKAFAKILTESLKPKVDITADDYSVPEESNENDESAV